MLLQSTSTKQQQQNVINMHACMHRVWWCHTDDPELAAHPDGKRLLAGFSAPPQRCQSTPAFSMSSEHGLDATQHLEQATYGKDAQHLGSVEVRVVQVGLVFLFLPSSLSSLPVQSASLPPQSVSPLVPESRVNSRYHCSHVRGYISAPTQAFDVCSCC